MIALPSSRNLRGTSAQQACAPESRCLNCRGGVTFCGSATTGAFEGPMTHGRQRVPGPSSMDLFAQRAIQVSCWTPSRAPARESPFTTSIPDKDTTSSDRHLEKGRTRATSAIVSRTRKRSLPGSVPLNSAASQRSVGSTQFRIQHNRGVSCAAAPRSASHSATFVLCITPCTWHSDLLSVDR